MSLNISVIEKVAEQIVANSQIEKAEQETTFADRIETLEDMSVNSLGTKQGIITQYNESETWAGSNGQAVATPGNTDFSSITVKYKFVNASGVVTKEAMDNADDPTSNWKIAQELASTVMTAKKSLNRQLCNGDGIGTLAIVTTAYNGGAATSIICAPSASWTHGTQFVGKSKWINVVTSTGGATRSGSVADTEFIIQVSDNNVGTSTLTTAVNAPTDMIVGDKIVAERSVNLAVQGLPYQVAATGNFFGLSRSSYDAIRSSEYDASGAALTIPMVDALHAKLKFKAGVGAVMGKQNGMHEMWTAPAMIQQYRASSYSLAITAAGGDLDAGYSNQVKLNGYVFNEDTDLPGNAIWFLKMNTFKKVVRGSKETPFEIIDFGTGKFTPMYDSKQRLLTSWQFVVGGYANLFCNSPRDNGVVKNISTSGLELGNF